MSEFEREPWIDAARALLDESAARLDAAALSRLNRARQAALAQRRRTRWFVWLPATGLAAASVLVLALALRPGAHAPAPVASAPPAAATASLPNGDVDAADDSVEFYQNLEFYAWLEAQEAEDGDG